MKDQSNNQFHAAAPGAGNHDRAVMAPLVKPSIFAASSNEGFFFPLSIPDRCAALISRSADKAT